MREIDSRPTGSAVCCSANLSAISLLLTLHSLGVGIVVVVGLTETPLTSVDCHPSSSVKTEASNSRKGDFFLTLSFEDDISFLDDLCCGVCEVV